MTFPKVLHYIGLASCILLVIACFLPWAYYADLHESFTGFFSEQNLYGKPGKFLTLLAVLVFALMLLPKIWAKRTNLFLSALAVGYAIKSYILFTSCYNAYCPEKRLGIFLVMICVVIMFIAAMFPHMALKQEDKS